MIRKAARPRSATPVVTYALIGICCAVFVLGPTSGLTVWPTPPGAESSGPAQLAAQSAYFAHWGVVPEELWHGPPGELLTPLTALFLHGNWLHLLGNMLFLHVFGAMAEERMGRVAFALFYLAAGVLALLGYAAAHAHSEQTLVGASGAISGVLGAFLYLFPRARVTSLFPFLFFLPLRFPAWAVLLFWFVLQWLAARTADDRPGVAYLAHVVGFSLGFLYAWARYRRAVRVKDAAGPHEGPRSPGGQPPTPERSQP
ncbi:membrane protein [Streptomyces eurocidicus]|uniref:Membrane associated rhomboid family serine protease n=1 Tax=Streptomyces eurocidicus TaxID=66423 RepID=A0A2N8P1Y4_STREU|nr:rhomboid family intramembrane serine protease [Streptomyces eurocidicus]MBB5118591.1 membrane associated rhomboid family serine protease [Streptomyces eurocidicus]MBF6052041.1 rhomboid family intramembrane serine protease [Streptomyces eurocidicus]PNE35023.1 membrane protein [Streptomyces eurocidicus]